jgi:amino acid adenylation domain-containing protein
MSEIPQTQVGYRLSAQQQRLWQLTTGGAPIRAQILVRLDGDLDSGRLAAALRHVVGRHEALRTRFHQVAGTRTAIQVVHADETSVIDWAERSALGFDDHRWRAWLADEMLARRTVPTDPAGDAPVRALLVAEATDRHMLLLTVSALAADSEALRVVVAELADQYATGAPPADDEVLQYAQYVEWQHELSGSALGGETTDATIRFTLRTAGRPGREVLDRPLSAALAAEVHRYAAHRNIDPVAVLLAGWHALLWRASGQPVIAVGTAFPGRGHDEMRDCVGPFARWLGTLSTMDESTTFDALAREIDRQRGRVVDIEEYVSTTDVIEWTTTFACTSTPQVRWGGGVAYTVVWEDVDDQPDELRLTCVLDPGALESITTNWRYLGDRFAPDHVHCLADQYPTLLAGMLDRSTRPIHLVSALSSDAHAAVLAMSRTVGPGRPPDRCVHELFEDQVERTPTAPAVRSGDQRWSYRELNQRANRVAHALLARGVGAETPVAVCVGHHAGLVVALLAVLKAGGAYVPIDPDWPSARRRELAARAGCRVALSDEATISDFPGIGVDPAVLLAEPTVDVDNPNCPVSPDNLAYVMFTSGSTGRPKGVSLPHRAVANYLVWSANTYLAGHGDGSLVHSSIAFDLTVTGLFAPLVAGGSVRVEPAWRDPFALCAELTTEARADLCKLTPSQLAIVNHARAEDDQGGAVGSLVLGGEALTSEQAQPWLAHGWAERVFNEYGPTETAVGCTVHEVLDASLRKHRFVGAADTGEVPIGRPIDNLEVYVLDADMELVAVGMPGEIYVGGAGLARGYLDEPALSAERFVPHPFATVPGSRLYRTGDIGCLGPDGELRFLGRADDQVKIRGVRVEPAEVGAVLREHPAVLDAVLLAGDGRLTAYLTATGTTRPATAELRAFLGERLPSQFLPEQVRWLDEIPLTANGKVDRAALAQVTQTGPVAVTEPVDTAELVVVRVFEELLGTGPVDVADDFFDLGGHSLLAVQLIARLNTLFHRNLTVSALFDAPPTPRRLARSLGGDESDGWPRSLVPLRGGTDGVPLFCVHPAGGDVLGYRDLASSAELRRPLYGLQAPPLHSPDEEQSIEFLADHYLAELRAAQPDGPYALLGWSMGGLVAFELAHRLVAAGSLVARLLLVDSFLAEQLPPYQETTALRQFAERIGHMTGIDLRATFRDERDVYAAAGLRPSEQERAHLTHILHLTHAHLRAVHNYRPRPLDVPATLVQAADGDAEARAGATASWKALCTGAFQTLTLPGDHFSLLREPNADELARGIERLLEPGATSL